MAFTTKHTNTRGARRSKMGFKRTPPPRRTKVGRAAIVGAAVAGTVFAAVTGAQFDIIDN